MWVVRQNHDDTKQVRDAYCETYVVGRRIYGTGYRDARIPIATRRSLQICRIGSGTGRQALSKSRAIPFVRLVAATAATLAVPASTIACQAHSHQG